MHWFQRHQWAAGESVPTRGSRWSRADVHRRCFSNPSSSSSCRFARACSISSLWIDHLPLRALSSSLEHDLANPAPLRPAGTSSRALTVLGLPPHRLALENTAGTDLQDHLVLTFAFTQPSIITLEISPMLPEVFWGAG
jgi:hypothetical protein